MDPARSEHTVPDREGLVVAGQVVEVHQVENGLIRGPLGQSEGALQRFRTSASEGDRDEDLQDLWG